MAFVFTGIDSKSSYGDSLLLNSWTWHAIWQYYEIYHPELALKLPDAHTNGKKFVSEDLKNEFLNALIPAEDSYKLAVHPINAGTHPKMSTYIAETTDFLESLPLLDCQACVGTGRQRLGIIHPGETGDQCTACDGKGSCEAYILNYKLDPSRVYSLILFLQNCTSFYIE